MPFAAASTVRRSIKESLSDDRLSEADAEIIANSCSDNALRRRAVGFGEKCHKSRCFNRDLFCSLIAVVENFLDIATDLQAFHGFHEGKLIRWCDPRLAVELAPDGAGMPAEHAGKLGLSARAALQR